MKTKTCTTYFHYINILDEALVNEHKQKLISKIANMWDVEDPRRVTPLIPMVVAIALVIWYDAKNTRI